MNLCNSSVDSPLPRKNSCESHVSVYYEQDQKKEPSTGPPPHVQACSDDEKVYENPPVEIDDECTTNIDLPPLVWHGYENCPKLLTVTNTGRTILINGHWMNVRPYIEGGPLNGTYLFSQIHFHCPSEHEINGKRYPLEMHIVHYKTTYLTQEKAMQEKDGTVVLVYLFELTNTCETVVSQITKLGCELKEVNSRTECTEIALNKLITPFFSNYYIYWGSLTTKKNKYLLQWIINCDLLEVTKKEVEELSNIITSAIGLTIKQTPRLKPEFDDIYHVGEADYSLPPLKISPPGEDVCTVCKRYETVPLVSCSCKVEKVECDETDDNDTPKLQLVCECTSKTQTREYSCRKHGDKYICRGCRSVEVSSCSRCSEGREGVLLGKIFSGQMRPRKKAQLCCDVEEDGCDGIVLKCKNKSLLKDYYKNMKKKQKKTKQNKSPKPKKSSGDESDKASSKSSKTSTKSSKSSTKSSKSSTKSSKSNKSSAKPSKSNKSKPKSKHDIEAQSEESEVEKVNKSLKKDFRFKEEDESSISIEEITIKRKKKKKKEMDVHESLVSLKRDQSRPSLKTITVLPQIEPSRSCLNTISPKSSAHDESEMEKKQSSVIETEEAREEEENKKLECAKFFANDVHETEEEKKTDVEIHELKITQTCEIIEEPLSVVLTKESKSNIDKEKTEPNSLKDGITKSPAVSRSAKSRSKSRVNVQKTKDSESPDRKNLALRKSKSKSPVSDIFPKNKASMKKESERSECADSKVVTSEASKSKMGKTKTVTEIAKSAQEVKCPVKKSTPAIENLKSDSAPSKDTKTRCAKLRKKSTEEAKGKNKADSEGQNDKQDYDITTIFEKKQDGKKGQSLVGDSNDVNVNFLLTPDHNVKSDPSCAAATSESDFTTEKKASESVKKNGFSQDFTVNTATVAGSEFPTNDVKEPPQGCLLMEHIFRTENKEKAGEFFSQEYHVAIMYDQCVLQEYRGMFHPQELRLGDCEQLELVPRYPEPDHFNFQLQECFIKKQSLDQICVRVKFLLKDMKVLHVSENGENKPNGTSEKNEKLLLDQHTQCNLKELDLVTSSILKSVKQDKNNDKILDPRSSEILIKQYKLENEEKQKQEPKNEEKQKQEPKNEEKQKQEPKNEEKQKQEPKNEEKQKQQLKGQEKQKQQLKQRSIHWENEPQKCTNKPQNDSDVYLQEASRSSVAEQLSTDSSLRGNKPESERGEKKLKSLFVKRRKTVYFIYDKVEKDENTGKKVFVGSFKTKEEVDGLKKQKIFQENDAVSASEKSEETYEAKGLPPLENTEADPKVTKCETSPSRKSSSFAKNSPSTSQDIYNKNKDLVTLHKYKPKYPETGRFRKDCKNMLPIRVMDNSQRNIDSSKNLTNALKEKAAKADVHELHQTSGFEPPKETLDPDDGKTEKKMKAKSVVPNKNRENYSHTEVTVPEKSSKAKEDSARDNSPKSMDKKESQAALILIPVEAESLSKTEVILIEQSDKLKKDKKKDKNIP